MELKIERQTVVDDALMEAFARLMPQLSSRLGAVEESLAHRIVESETTALFVARSESQIEGMTTLTWYDVPSGRKAWIEDVVVDQSLRGLGLGRRLVEMAIGYASEIKADKVMLTSSPHREAARAMYRKLGFEEANTSVFALKICDKK